MQDVMELQRGLEEEVNGKAKLIEELEKRLRSRQPKEEKKEEGN
jgi:hypothetical protein